MSPTHTVLSGTRNARILSAFYDLGASPNTFDILVFLVLAEIERREARCDAMHLYIVPGPNQGFRGDTDVSNLTRQQYIQRNVLLSSHALMPSCAGVTLCSSREAVEEQLRAATIGEDPRLLVFPTGYSVHLPQAHYHFFRIVERWQRGIAVPPLQPSRHALEMVNASLRQWCGDRKVLTVTLRETAVQAERNSNLEAWGRFVASLDKDEYAVLVLRDLEKIHEALPPAFANCLPYPEAVISVELRAALYQLAYLNLCINNGPAAMLLQHAFDAAGRACPLDPGEARRCAHDRISDGPCGTVRAAARRCDCRASRSSAPCRRRGRGGIRYRSSTPRAPGACSPRSSGHRW